MNKLTLTLASFFLVGGVMSIAACSSDSGDDDTSSSSSSGATTSSSGGGSSSGGSSSGNNTSSSGGGSSSGGSSGGTSALNGCTNFTDKTAESSTEVTFSNPIPEAQRCQKIKVGTTVTWKGVGSAHPLVRQGGDDGSPIPEAPVNDGDQTYTFDTVGKFGYVCSVHSNMQGAIEVVAAE